MIRGIPSCDRLQQKIRRRLDAEAIDQLRAEVARLSTDVERLEAENAHIRECLATCETQLDFWWRQATDMQLAMCESTGQSPGITQDGALVCVAKEH